MIIRRDDLELHACGCYAVTVIDYADPAKPKVSVDRFVRCEECEARGKFAGSARTWGLTQGGLQYTLPFSRETIGEATNTTNPSNA